MRAELSKVFDECLTRITRGEAVKTCLAEYPHLRHQLVPLLHTAFSIKTAPKVLPSDDMRQLSKGRLMARLRESSMQAAKSLQANPASSRMTAVMTAAWRMLERIIAGPAKVAVPLTLALVVALEGIFLFGLFDFISPSHTPAFASGCTLSTLTGRIELQNPGSSIWEEAETGMTIKAGSWVRTAPDSDAMLTFFNGTTVKLEPGTVLLVEQAEGVQENQPTIIVLKQQLGRTWSRVTKLTDPGSHYEIQTPSASALVRGTQFVTEVDEAGATSVQTIEGLVSVSAEGEEVFLPAGRQTTVEPGAPPSEPVPLSHVASDSTGDTEVPGNQPPAKAVPTEPSAEIAEPREAASKGQDTEVEQGQREEEPIGQGQDGLSAQDSGQDQATDTEEGQSGGQSNDYMWWLIGIVVLFSFGAATLMWRRQ